MSAIAGVVHVDGRQVSEQTLAGMAAASPSRGFDGTTQWRDGAVGFIRTAHATTPEAVGEVQPVIGTGSGIAMLFDGRLDNRGELLDLLGWHVAERIRAPDAVVAHALFERLGADFVHRLVGEFAIAIWQPRDQRLTLLRSPLGWRPLLWAFDGKTLGFATEPRSLVLGLDLPRRLNEAAIGEYLSARFVTHVDTFWQGVQRLPPGAALALEAGQVRQWHWHSQPFEDLSHLSPASHVERFRELFDDALVATTRASGGVAAQLSGGLDSSSVVCRATELHRSGRIEHQVEAISARFPGELQDETEYSSAVERHLGITATVVGSKPFDLDEARNWCAATYQMPLRPNVLDAFSQALGHVRQAGGRVLLTGEGGDEWLDGSHAHWPDLLLRGRWLPLLSDGRRAWPGAPGYVTARRLAYHSVMPFVSNRYRAQLMHPNIGYGESAPAWVRTDWADRVGLRDRWHKNGSPVSGGGFAQRSRYSVFMEPRRHIMYENVQAYAESLGVELRHPFHDLRLTQFYMGAAGTALRADGHKKFILREAMRGTLPEVVRERRDKAAFVTHIGDTVMAYFRQRPPEEMLCARYGWADPAVLRDNAEQYQAWRAAGRLDQRPPGALGALWFAIALDIWLENAFG